ncbi:MAG TPA: M13 family metallopeptidase [Steroidobacteraceae bacterium]|nr:M13 family metallopeptidase [Steroidobacteraceae bacterium]
MRVIPSIRPVLQVLSLASLALGIGVSACSADKGASPGEVSGTSGLMFDRYDRNVRAQDDFYRFVNGKWLADTQIPADKSNYGVFTMLGDKSEQNLRAIVEEAAAKPTPPGSDAQKVGDFYASFMDESRVDSLGLAPLEPELARIATIRTSRDLAVGIGRLQRIATMQPLAYYVGIDEKNSSAYISHLYQSGITMPDRDYYLSDDARMKSVREQHAAYVRDLLTAAGDKDAAAMAERIIAIETRLAKAQWTRVENRNAEKTYNKFTIAELQAKTPNLDWRALFEGAAAPRIDAIVVAQPSFLFALDAAVKQVPIAQWREYLRFHLIDSYAPHLSKQFADLHFEFYNKALSGVTQQRPRWKRGVDAVERSIGELAGKVYVERHFTPEAKERVAHLVANLQKAFAAGIDQLEWMSAETRAQAQTKLAKFTPKIGYPDKWRDWSKLEVKRDDLVGNIRRAAIVAFDRDIAKLGGPVDRTEWQMTPQTVNAYYNPPANEIVFPAAILQPPFFDVKADDAVNYGAIGSVIGHEISHGFDDEGRQYDGDGNLRNWWTETDDKEFRVRATALAKQYAAYAPLANEHLNGELTLGENIADLVGLAMAYHAYQLSLDGKKAPKLDGYSGEQRFFLGFGQVWARKYRDDELRKRLLTDPHSPSEFRVNGVVINQPEFYTAFDLKPKDKLFVDPKDRVKIW